MNHVHAGEPLRPISVSPNSGMCMENGSTGLAANHSQSPSHGACWCSRMLAGGEDLNCLGASFGQRIQQPWM